MYDLGFEEKFFQGVRRLMPCPKIRQGAKQKKNKKKSLLKFGPIFCPKLGEEQKKQKNGLHSNLVPYFAHN